MYVCMYVYMSVYQLMRVFMYPCIQSVYLCDYANKNIIYTYLYIDTHDLLWSGVRAFPFILATYKHTHLTIIFFHDSPTIANLKDLASRILHHQPMQTPETMDLSGDQKVGLESFNP